MRMWGVDPLLMCDQHLLGEHVEMHMFVGTIQKGTSMAGYLANGLVVVSMIPQRHKQLAAEMERRGMRHKSPLPSFEWNGPDGHIDDVESAAELMRRCPKCQERFNFYRDQENSK